MHKTMSCEEVMARLWEYIDGELTPERQEMIHQHLEKCGRCYPRYDFHRTFRRFMRRQSDHPAPPSLRRKIFEQLLEEE